MHDVGSRLAEPCNSVGLRSGRALSQRSPGGAGGAASPSSSPLPGGFPRRGSCMWDQGSAEDSMACAEHEGQAQPGVRWEEERKGLPGPSAEPGIFCREIAARR